MMHGQKNIKFKKD